MLSGLTWGELAHRRERSLELAGELLYYGGSLCRAADRVAGSTISRAIMAIREEVARRGMLGPGLLEPAEDQRIAMVDFLRVTAWAPELVVFERSGARRKACLKLRLQGGPGGKDASRAYALSIRLMEALTHFPSVLRLLEGAGGKIELREPEILEILGSAARQLATVGERDGTREGGLQVADLRSLASTLAAHTTQLATAAARALSPAERLQRLSARRQQTARATSTASASAGAAVLEDDARRDRHH